MKKTHVCAISLALTLFCLPTLKAVAEIVDRVVASAGNELVTLYDVEREGKALFEQVAASSAPEELESRLYEARKNVVERLLEKILLLREGKRMGIEISESDIDNTIENIKRENKIDQNTLVQALAQEGLTFEAYRAEVREQAIRSKVIDRKVRSSIRIRDEDIEIYYQRNAAQFKVDEEIKARHILFLVPAGAKRQKIEEVRKRALEVLDKAKDGKDFHTLAKIYSEGPSGSSGGDLGFFKRDVMVKGFSDAAFALERGEISGIVRSSFGYHIIKLEERRGGTLMPLEDARDKISDILYPKEVEKGIKAFIRELKDSEDVEVRI